MNCDFNFSDGKCNISCPKYPMCSHGYIESQLSDIQKQINTLYNVITKIIMKQKETENNLEDVVAMLNDLYQDSQEIQNNFLEN